MTDARPVLLGMNNPHSDDPRHALAPYPRGVTGHRIWTMLTEVCGAGRREYMDAFDRRNVLVGRAWSASAAREPARAIWNALEGRTVLVLGQAVVGALNLYRPPVMTWRTDHGVRWCEVPHPSGLNRWYNEPLNRTLVALRLEELYQRSVDQLVTAPVPGYDGQDEETLD